MDQAMEKILGTLESDCNKTCPKCGEPLYKEIELLGKMRIVPRICKCREVELEKEKERSQNLEKQARLRQIINNSLMDEKFRECTFETWDFSKGSKKMYNIGKKYSDSFQEMKSKSVGLLIHGNPGNGKTYTTACIANALINNMVPVVCVSIDALLDRIKQTYSNYGNEGEDTVLRSLNNADLLIIDDLGTEQDTDWAKTKIYNILDARYRNKLPLIITTNIPLIELKNKYHERTYDRLIEMCTPVLNDSKSIRVRNAKEKTEILKNLLQEN